MKVQRWQDWTTVVLGVWLVVSPLWMPAYESSSSVMAWNSYLAGALAVLFASAALVDRKLWEEGVNLAIGIWLVIGPFVLGYFFGFELGAALNQLIVGLVIAVNALWLLSAGSTSAREVLSH